MAYCYCLKYSDSVKYSVKPPKLKMRADMLRYHYLIMIVLALFGAGCGNDQNTSATKKTEDFKDTTSTPAAPTDLKNILFFGTSLTAGLGVDPEQAYPALIQDKIDSLNLPYKVINAGLSGETSAAGKNRIDWLLKQPVDIFVLELGANDGLRGVAVPETKANLQDLIDRVKKKYPRAKLVITGMQMPPSMGQQYTTDFKNLFPAIAKENKMSYVPFLLEGVGGVPSLIQDDGLHPNAKGHIILAENVWKILQSLL
jgi:acyl-CoA thioesterase-1